MIGGGGVAPTLVGNMGAQDSKTFELSNRSALIRQFTDSDFLGSTSLWQYTSATGFSPL